MNEEVRTQKVHDKQIMDLQSNKDLTFLVSSSKDNTAKVDANEGFQTKKTFSS